MKLISFKNRGSDQIIRLILAVLSGLLFLASCLFQGGFFSHETFRYYTLLASLFLFLITVFPEKAREWIFKYRYLLGLLLFIILVAFGINFSSIGHFHLIFGKADTNDLLGVSRGVRTDEWALFTPMTISQYLSPNGHFSYLSPVLRGVDTDMFLIYGQPVMDIGTLFRPFFWGCLFLPVNQGIAWFWCGRLIALFLVSLEFGLMITENRRGYALGYAFLLTFSPFVQWWFAINGLAEMLIYGQLALVLFKKYLNSPSFGKRTACTAGILFSAAGFILTFYPAWMMPLALFIVVSAVVVFVKYRKNASLKTGDLFAALGLFLITAAILLHVFLKSKDFISLTLNTAYPGKRSENGGGAFSVLFSYITNLFLPFNDLIDLTETNESELARVLSFSPLPEFLALFVMIREKKKDSLLCCLLALCLVFLIYTVFGLPGFLSKVLLLSFSTSGRVMQVLGFLELIILFRALSLSEKPLKLSAAIPAGALLTALPFGVQYLTKNQFMSMKVMAIAFLALGFFAVLFLLAPGRKKIKQILPVFLALLSLMAGGLVNPVRNKVTDVLESEPLKMLRSINDSDEGLLAVVGSYPITNIPVLIGARTLNATNIYPNLDTWRLLDPEGKYEQVYNRYAHVTLELKEAGEAEFSLDSNDQFTLTVTLKDLKALGVKYLLTQDIPALLNETNSALTGSSDGLYVYRLK